MAISSPARGLIIAAPGSGSGKTTVTLALLSAMRRRGLVVQPYKCGPDYIDPAFHSAASGRPSFNLDSWAMLQTQVASLLRAGDDADISIAEGVMGLFDGVAAPGAWGNGATADIAALTGWPVVLVIDPAFVSVPVPFIQTAFTPEMEPPAWLLRWVCGEFPE